MDSFESLSHMNSECKYPGVQGSGNEVWDRAHLRDLRRWAISGLWVELGSAAGERLQPTTIGRGMSWNAYWMLSLLGARAEKRGAYRDLLGLFLTIFGALLTFRWPFLTSLWRRFSSFEGFVAGRNSSWPGKDQSDK